MTSLTQDGSSQILGFTGLTFVQLVDVVTSCSVLLISVNKLVDVTKQLVELRHVTIHGIERNARLNPREQRRVTMRLN